MFERFRRSDERDYNDGAAFQRGNGYTHDGVAGDGVADNGAAGNGVAGNGATTTRTLDDGTRTQVVDR